MSTHSVRAEVQAVEFGGDANPVFDETAEAVIDANARKVIDPVETAADRSIREAYMAELVGKTLHNASLF